MQYNNDQDDNLLAEAYLNEVWFKRKCKLVPTKKDKEKAANTIEAQLKAAREAAKETSKSKAKE